MQLIIKVCLLLFFSISCLYSQDSKFTIPPSDRVKQNIDFDWLFINRDFSCEEETHQVNQLPWKKVNLPHDWSIEGPFDKKQNPTQGFLPMGISWYRNGIMLPESWEDKKVFIVFDGVYKISDVWMNYAFLGHHESGYTSFVYDITDYVRYGNRTPNGLRVRVDGRRHEEDMYEGNGIYRHVWLLATNKLHIDNWGTFVTTPNVSNSKASIEVKTKVKNEYDNFRKCKLTTNIVDANGVVVAEIKENHTIQANGEYEFVQNTEVNQPQLWSIENPYLYKAYSIVEDDNKIVDTYETTFGIRTFYFDSDKGFFLNGKHVKLKGFNAHYDFAGLGTAIPDRIHWNLMKAMKNAGFNFYRSSHNPATPERLDVCDQLGILVWDEVERKLESAEIEHKLVEETIVRDRNHPSIILWSLENESPLESTVFGAKIMKSATELAHKLDPTRLTTFAASMPVNKKGYGENVDVVSYNYHWERADQDHIDFPHWKIGLISEYSAARARRGVYGIQHFTEQVEGSSYDLNNGEIQTMYQMCDRVEDFWGRIKTRDYIGGGCLWSGYDSWGEGNAWPFISRGDGALDLCFFPKDVYYYFISQWIDKPMVHLFPHWNWQGKEGDTLNVWAYSNCDYVELFLNDHSLGKKIRPSEQPLFDPKSDKEMNQVIHSEHIAWQVPYDPGTLRAEGIKGGKIVTVEEVMTTASPYKIKLSYMMSEFVGENEIPPLTADGRDIIVIKAAIVDENENVVPTAENLVHFSVEGNGKIIGVGNGNITSHEPNKVNDRKAFSGLCAAIIQSTDETGQFTLRAESDGLKSDEIKIETVSPTPVSIAVFAKPYSISLNQGTSIITAEIRDRFGSIVSTSEENLIFTLNGPATFENGKNVIETDVTEGKAELKIKLTDQPGEVSITVISRGLIPGKVELLNRNK